MQAVQNQHNVEKFWAEMRSTAYLFHRSPHPSQIQRHKLVRQLGDILGKRIITYPPVYSEFGIGADTPYRVKKEILLRSFSTQPPDESEKRFMKFMINKAAQAQKANWTWRITQEAEAKQTAGWYPFFVTLTVDPKRTDPERLWREGREFRKYIRRLANIAAEQLGHPPPHKKTKYFGYRPESDYVTYAAVIEHGKSLEHHHAHLMVWMREIPSLWKIDPTRGRLPTARTERECRPMRQLWPWSIPSQCPSLYFRSKGDIWSKMGFVTPIDNTEVFKSGKENPNFGKPIKINPVEAVGNYVTKYMQKGTRLWNHRMKCTRNLGMQKIKQIMEKLDEQTIEALSWRPQESSQLRLVSSIHSVPQGLIRSLAKRRLFQIRYQSNSLDLKSLMKTNYEHYSQMLKSVRDGARPDRMPSAEFYDWLQSFLPVESEFCEKRLLDSHRKMAYHFPRKVFAPPPIVIGANEIGFTQCI